MGGGRPGVNVQNRCGPDIALTLTPNPTNTFYNGFGHSMGWEFTANANMTVNELGWFANPNLTETHNVGIYTEGGALVTATTVATSDPLTANFRCHTLSAVALRLGVHAALTGAHHGPAA